MPGKSDIEEPPETIYSLKYKVKKFFNRLFKSTPLSNTQNEFTGQQHNLEASSVQPNIIIQNFDSFAEKFQRSRFSDLNIYHLASNEDIIDTIDFFHSKYNDRIPHFTLLKKEDNIPVMDGSISVSTIDEYLSERLEQNEE